MFFNGTVSPRFWRSSVSLIVSIALILPSLAHAGDIPPEQEPQSRGQKRSAPVSDKTVIVEPHQKQRRYDVHDVMDVSEKDSMSRSMPSFEKEEEKGKEEQKGRKHSRKRECPSGEERLSSAKRFSGLSRRLSSSHQYQHGLLSLPRDVIYKIASYGVWQELFAPICKDLHNKIFHAENQHINVTLRSLADLWAYLAIKKTKPRFVKFVASKGKFTFDIGADVLKNTLSALSRLGPNLSWVNFHAMYPESVLEAVSDLRHCPRLRTLSLSTPLDQGYNSLFSLAPLAQLTQLECLSLDSKYINWMSYPENFVNVKDLQIGKLCDLPPIERFTGLESLHIESEPTREIYSVLSSMTSLRQLRSFELSGSDKDTNSIHSMKFLSGLVGLNRLVVKPEFTLRTLEPISGLHQLEELSLTVDANQPYEKAAHHLANLTRLRKLSLHSAVQDLKGPLSILTGLEHLSLSFYSTNHDGPLPAFECSWVEPMTRLRELMLYEYTLENVTVLNRMTQLRTLGVTHSNGVRPCFTGLTGLRTLIIHFAQPFALGSHQVNLNLDWLKHFPLLTKLDLEYDHLSIDDLCAFSDASFIGSIPNLKRARFHGAHFRSYEGFQEAQRLENLVLSPDLMINDVVSPHDLSPLGELPRLQSLTMTLESKKTDYDFSVLGKIRSLRNLDLSESPLELSPKEKEGLKSITQLTCLGVPLYHVSDILLINSLKHLSQIRIYDQMFASNCDESCGCLDHQPVYHEDEKEHRELLDPFLSIEFVD